MIKRWLWMALAVAISTGVYFTIRYGLRPKPIPILDPTVFNHPEQIGIVIYKRLRHDIRAERVVLLGVDERVLQSDHIWSGFMQAALADKERVTLLSTHPVPGVQNLVPEPIEADTNDLARHIQGKAKAGQLVLVLTSTTEASHLAKGPLALQLEKIFMHPVLAISSFPLALTDSMRVDMGDVCSRREGASDTRPLLACASQRVGKKYQRKNLDPSKIWAVMERYGLKEYLLFLHSP